MENPEILGRIRMGRFIPVEIFWKKSDIFRVITFSPFFRNDRNCLYHLFGLPVPGFRSRESKNLPVFCKWYNSIPFLFSLTKTKCQQHLTEIFHRNFRTNGERSKFGENRKHKRKTDKVVKFSLVSVDEKHLLI